VFAFSFVRQPLTVVALASVSAAAPAAAQVTLTVYVETVLRAHPASRQARALEAAAAAERKAARLFPDPVLAYTRNQAGPPGGGSPRESEREFSVTQTIPWPGAWTAGRQAGDRAADALRAEGLAARWELEIEARTTFARLLHARRALEIARAAEDDALALRDLTARRADVGEAREADRIRAEVEWLRQQRLTRAAEREAATAERVLRTLAVEPLPDPLLLEGDLPQSIAPTDAAALEARLANANPRLLAAGAATKREAALLSLARRGRVPDLDVTWFKGEELDKEKSGFMFGLRLPLWNANRGEIARAAAATSLAAAGAERTRLEQSAALERARQAVDLASAQAEILEAKVLPAASRSLELARFSYEEGETSLLDLLDTQRTFRETQREAAASRLDLALALADVQRLVGPGFNPWR
jgi:cobalt-zinc-cadmium efflux system outer membrane protein